MKCKHTDTDNVVVLGVYVIIYYDNNIVQYKTVLYYYYGVYLLIILKFIWKYNIDTS